MTESQEILHNHQEKLHVKKLTYDFLHKHITDFFKGKVNRKIK